MKAFTVCKKSLKFSQKWRENWPLAKKIWARGGLRVKDEKLFKKHFLFQKKVLLKKFNFKQHLIYHDFLYIFGSDFVYLFLKVRIK